MKNSIYHTGQITADIDPEKLNRKVDVSGLFFQHANLNLCESFNSNFFVCLIVSLNLTIKDVNIKILRNLKYYNKWF